MDKKRKILKIAIFVFMALSISLTTSQTLAYWAEPTDATDTATATVDTGEWTQAFPYDPNYSYAVGDLATNNGNTYEAKKSGLLSEPGVDGGWPSDWDELGASQDPEEIPEYDPNYSYSVGDQVTNNGSIYEAKKSGLLREPGVEGGWKRDWNEIG